MANSINFTIPTIGTTADPAWESQINTALAAISTHTHDGANAGALLPPSSVSFANGGFNFNNQPQSNASYLDLAAQSSAPAGASGHGRLYVDTSGNLYYASSSNNAVKLATANSINYSSAAKGFVGSNYGNTGGAAFYNTGSSSWPFANSFYLYSSISTPSDDTGARALLGTGAINIKGFPGAACSLSFTDSSGLTTERPIFGNQNGGAVAVGEWGLEVSRVAGGASTPAYISSETATSLSALANTAQASARTYGFHVNAKPSDALTNQYYHFSVRSNFPGLTANGLVDLGFMTRNATDSSGTYITPSDGFGYRFMHALQYTSAPGQGAAAAAVEISWASVSSKQGRYSIRLAQGGNYYSVPAIDCVVNSGGSLSYAIGGNASYSSTNSLNIYGPTTINSGGLTTNGDSTFNGHLHLTNSLTIDANGAAITGTVAVVGPITAGSITGNTVTGTAGVFPGSTAFVPTAGKGGLWLNNQVVAWATISGPGVLGSNFNCLSVAHTAGTGVYTVTLTAAIANCGAFATCNTTDTTNPWHAQAIFVTSTSVEIITSNNAAAFADVAFSFMLIGQPA